MVVTGGWMQLPGLPEWGVGPLLSWGCPRAFSWGTSLPKNFSSLACISSENRDCRTGLMSLPGVAVGCDYGWGSFRKYEGWGRLPPLSEDPELSAPKLVYLLFLIPSFRDWYGALCSELGGPCHAEVVNSSYLPRPTYHWFRWSSKMISEDLYQHAS